MLGSAVVGLQSRRAPGSRRATGERGEEPEETKPPRPNQKSHQKDRGGQQGGNRIRVLLLASAATLVLLLLWSLRRGPRRSAGQLRPSVASIGLESVQPSSGVGAGGREFEDLRGDHQVPQATYDRAALMARMEGLKASRIRAESAMLYRTKLMSQAQLDAATELLSSTGDSTPHRTLEGEERDYQRKASPCLGSPAVTLPAPGGLYVSNNGGTYSHWAKKLGGPLDPRYVHMAMIERLGNGSLVAMWQQAKRPIEGTEQQLIYFKVSKGEDLNEWHPDRKLRVPHQGALWSPVLHFQEGRLYVLYTESRDCIRAATANAPPRWFPGGDVKMTSSTNLVSWEKPTVVYNQDQEGGVPKVLANKLIVRDDGAWVLPFWREIPRGGKSLTKGKCITSNMRASAGVLVSRNKGASWRAYGEVTHPLTWLIENTVVELDRDKSLLMLFRTWAGRIFQSRSYDGGRSWSLPGPTMLPNPDAKISMIRLQGSSDLLLAFNDHQKYAEDGFTRFRTALRLAISHDQGATWARVAQVDEMDMPGWQFHYPTLMQSGCNVTVAYSRTFVASNEGTPEAESGMDMALNESPGIRVMTFDLSLLAAGARQHSDS